VNPNPSGFEMYHCTLYGSGSGGTATLLTVGTYGAGTPVCKNGIVDAVNFTTKQVSDGTIDGGGSFVGDADFTNSANQDFSLLGTSSALDNGVLVDVLNAFNANADLRVLAGNTADSGAYEEVTSGPTQRPLPQHRHRRSVRRRRRSDAARDASTESRGPG